MNVISDLKKYFHKNVNITAKTSLSLIHLGLPQLYQLSWLRLVSVCASIGEADIADLDSYLICSSSMDGSFSMLKT